MQDNDRDHLVPPRDQHEKAIRNAAIEECAQAVEHWFSGESWFTNKNKAGIEIAAAVRALKTE